MQKQEALLVRVMDLFARRFDKHAVLRGGMALRILGCERMTNDVDYIFVPYRSKKSIVKIVVEALTEIPRARIRYSLNSKCLRIVLSVDDVSVQIEAKTALRTPIAVQNTGALAKSHGLPPRLIAIEDYPVALANKMAAWNERRLVRDLYDIWFYLKMGVHPDRSVLGIRLADPKYSRLVAKADHFAKGGSVDAFLAFLKTHVQNLSDHEIATSLGDYLATAEMRGLAMRMSAEFAKLF